MEVLNKDSIGYLFQFLTPIDWYCTSLVCKPWWRIIQKFLKERKQLFYKKLHEVIVLSGLDIKKKNVICLRPLYYLKPLYTGCQGEIINYVCLRHSEDSDLCQKCLLRPISPYCFGDFCDTNNCRDYMLVLRNGIAERVVAYPCSISECKHKTDAPNGLCYQHATNDFYENKRENKIKPTYNCIGTTQKGENCKKTTKSRVSKCHLHIKGPI
jgi:hypothetical protein